MAQMSDDQVVREAQRYQESGMSESQIFQELSRKGVTAVQFQRIRTKLSQQGAQGGSSSRSTTSTVDNSRVDSFNPDMYQQPSQVNPMDTIPAYNRVFGYDFFKQTELTFAPNMNMPTPSNYVLGPGDEVLIDIWGDSELSVKSTVSPDGYITASGIGRVQVSGMSVGRATAHIKEEFSYIYSDLYSDDPHTFLGVSVGNTRTIKVNVMGEVMRPGTYTLTSFASAFHALYAAGGPNSLGGLRSIQVFRCSRGAK